MANVNGYTTIQLLVCSRRGPEAVVWIGMSHPCIAVCLSQMHMGLSVCVCADMESSSDTKMTSQLPALTTQQTNDSSSIVLCSQQFGNLHFRKLHKFRFTRTRWLTLHLFCSLRCACTHRKNS